MVDHGCCSLPACPSACLPSPFLSTILHTPHMTAVVACTTCNNRATAAVPEEQRYDMFLLYIKKVRVVAVSSWVNETNDKTRHQSPCCFGSVGGFGVKEGHTLAMPMPMPCPHQCRDRPTACL